MYTKVQVQRGWRFTLFYGAGYFLVGSIHLMTLSFIFFSISRRAVKNCETEGFHAQVFGRVSQLTKHPQFKCYLKDHSRFTTLRVMALCDINITGCVGYQAPGLVPNLL